MLDITLLNSILSKVEESSRISTLDYYNYLSNSAMQVPDIDQALTWMDKLSRVGPGIVTALIIGLFFWFGLRLIQKYDTHQEDIEDSKQKRRHEELEWIKSLWKKKE